jgi:hypothetical protein
VMPSSALKIKALRERARHCMRHFPWPSDDAIILKALEERK